MTRPAPLLIALGLLVVALATLAGPVGAQSSALGNDGELYSLRLGAAGDLFESPAGDPDAPILALDVLGADGALSRLTVPGSEDEDLELSASMVFEPDSDSVWVIWASQYHFAHSRIRLIQYSDGEWSDPIDITDDPFTYKTAPMVAVTRETFSHAEADGGLVTHERTILHTLWFEEVWNGDAVLYSPLILVDGQFVDRQTTVKLADLAVEADRGGKPQRHLQISPAISAGDSDHKVVATILDAATNRLLTFEVEALALEITQLAGDVADAVDPETCGQGGLVALSNDARANIVTIARKRGFRGSMAATLANESRAVLQSASSDLCDRSATTISRRIVETVIDAGAELSGGLLTLESDARANIVTIARKGGLDHRLVIRGMTSRTAPQVGGRTKVFVSRDGASNLVAWETGEGVRYVESEADGGWSEPHDLTTANGLEGSDTLRLLSGRVDG